VRIGSVYLSAPFSIQEFRMDHRLWLAAVVAVSGCSKQFATPSEIRTTAAPEQVFECVKQQLNALEYKQTSVDSDALRINGAKVDAKTRRADTQFRRMLNKLEVDIGAEADGQTSLQVLPKTFAEYTTQRGPTEVQEQSSAEVQADAKTLQERCKS